MFIFLIEDLFNNGDIAPSEKVKLLEKLLSVENIKLDVFDNNHFTCLMMATSCPTKIFEKILEKTKGTINSIDCEKESAIFHLLKEVPETDQYLEKEEPFTDAFLQKLELVVKEGAKLDLVDSKGVTVFHLASSNIKVLETLLDYAEKYNSPVNLNVISQDENQTVGHNILEKFYPSFLIWRLIKKMVVKFK